MAENEKIIIVQKTANQYFRTKKIWQYDVGHTLRFDGFNLPYTFEVHFAHSPNGESQKQIGQDGICEVPAEYTQNSGFAYAWLYEVTEDTGLTKHQIEIPVEGRAKPTDQEPTPAEQSVIDQTITASNRALEKTLEAQQAAEDAAESVKNAGATAETLAPGSPATVVVRDVNGVKTFEFGIPEGQQGETGETPNFTVGSVTTLPAGSPVTVTITGTAENPVLNIGIPQGAQGGKGDTGAVPHFTIGTVTTLPPDSPATVTITGTDENPILNLGIPKGVQGQKGDKGDAFTYADFTEEQKTELIQGPIKTAQDEAVAAVQDKGDEVLESIPSDYSELTEDVSSLKSAINDKAPVIISTASGDIASFDDGADGMPVKSMTVQIEPVQSGTGDPSPDNVRPITGWAGANVTRAGKNLLDPDLIVDQASWHYVSIQLNPNAIYTVSANYPNDGVLILYAYNSNGWNSSSQVYTGKTVTVTTNADGELRLQQRRTDNTKSFANYIAQVEVGSYASELETYISASHPITFPTEAGTVYGGSLTINQDGTGRLVADREMMSLATVENWNSDALSSAGYIRYVYNIASKLAGDYLLCDTLPVRQSTIPASPTEEGICGYYANSAIYVAINASRLSGDFSTASGRSTAFKEYLADNPINIVYELATPITYDLTALEVLETLKGVNNIWADTGSVSVDYCADTKTYVDNAAPDAPVQDVQVNGASILQDGVANVPVASGSALGVVKTAGMGVAVNPSNGEIYTIKATSAQAKAGTANFTPIVPSVQHESTFYGLAKAAGDSTQSASSNAVGTYTDAAKVAIQKMLGIYKAPYRLIKEITITEETLNVVVNTDINGDHISLSDVIVYAQNIVGTGSSNCLVLINGDSYLGKCVTINNLFSTSTKTGVAWLRTDGGRFFAESAVGFTNTYSNMNLARNLNATGIFECSSITEIRLGSANSHKFTSGTITIYGR